MLIRRLISIVALCSVLIGCKPSTPTQPPTDCEWGAHVDAWLDVDGNGLWSEGETQLDNVVFYADDILNHYEKVAMAIEDGGDAEDNLNLWTFLPGCPKAEFEIYAIAPDGYELTTPSRLRSGLQDEIHTFAFGFKYILGAPTPRPSVPLSCSVLDAKGPNDVMFRAISEMAVAPDGAVWVISPDNNVFRFDPDDQSRTLFTTQDGIPEELARTIEISRDGTVWIGMNRGKVARYQGSQWKSYSVFDEFWGVDDLALTLDGTVWAASSLDTAKYSPVADKWSNEVIKENDLTAGYFPDTILNGPEGSLWFITNASVYEVIEPQVFDSTLEWIVHKENRQDETIPLTSIWAGSVFDGKYFWFAGESDGVISLVRYDPENKQSKLYNFENTGGAFVPGTISALAPAPDGSIWIGLAERGALHFVPDAPQAAEGAWYDYQAKDGVGDVVTDILVTPDNYVWFGSEGGFIARCELQQ